MKNNKISQAEIDSLNVKSAEDTYYNNNPQANKDIFDRFPEHIAGKYNAFIDYLSRNGEPVQSGDIVQMRIGPDGDLQVSTDGASWKNVVDTALAKKADKDTVYTKSEVDTAIGQKVEQLGAGDMAMIMYDANFNGVVDNSERLGGNLPEYYATKTAVTSAQNTANTAKNTADNAMPKANGTATMPTLSWDMADGGTVELRLTGNTNKTVALVLKKGDGTTEYCNLVSSDSSGQAIEVMPKFSGENVISSIDEDTVSFWRSKGTGLYYISKTGLITNQPAQWGFIVNYADGYRVKQLWFDIPNGVVAQRGGNTNGWNNSGNWTKFMMETGGTFTGNVTFTGNAIAYETARTTRSIFNNETRASSTTGTLQSVKYFIDVT